jgi:hypothetical protein
MPYDQHIVKKLITGNDGRHARRCQLNSYKNLAEVIVADNQAISIGHGEYFRFRRKGNLEKQGGIRRVIGGL